MDHINDYYGDATMHFLSLNILIIFYYVNGGLWVKTTTQ